MRRWRDTRVSDRGPAGRAEQVAVTGLAVVSAFGRGTAPLVEAVTRGEPGFKPVTRFDVSQRRASVAATLPGTPRLVDELAGVIGRACGGARLSGPDRAESQLLVAGRPDPVCAARGDRGHSPGAVAAALADRGGLRAGVRAYTSACVSGTTAVADAAAQISTGRQVRAVVAGGFLVNSDDFAAFDAGRVLSDDGQVRPFSAGRRGMLLGDAAVAVVLESARSALRRRVPVLGWIAGWARAGDAYHVCHPHPGGRGLARAVTGALRRAGRTPAEVGYVNANGTGTGQSDAAETAALRLALGPAATGIPVSSTKSVHGHALEASGLLELAVTLLALRAEQLPVNANYLGPDEQCELDLVLRAPRVPGTPYALTVNSAFGGANTALLVRAA